VIWGRITIAMQEDGSALIRGGSGVESRVALPCTLGTLQSGATFAFNGCRYRGSMVFSGNDGTMINCVDVEDYLRSVVPSEMGKRSWQELEALKAQAVASRTYAYKRMQVCRQQPFDVVSTIADQVYGGALAETAEADSAIRSTRGLVVLWKDSLAAIYYHSTCGGQTAAIEDAWDKPSCPYLQSVSDRDPDGVPYCSFSPLFTWEERWSAGELSAIIRQNSGKKDETHFSGDLLGMSVVDRFPSGRIKTFRLAGSEDTMEVGGDRLRFILRRKSAGGALLRSSNFSIMENGPDYFSIRGCGYGHGVGMCQMGAIGRARRGERFDKILRIYFPGTEIKRIDSAKLAAR
jgi:stage II sporulation protein D